MKDYFIVVVCKGSFNMMVAQYKQAIKNKILASKFSQVPMSEFQIKIVMEQELINYEHKQKYTSTQAQLQRAPWYLFWQRLLDSSTYNVILLTEEDRHDDMPISFTMYEDVNAFNHSLNMILEWYELTEQKPDRIKEFHRYVMGKNQMQQSVTAADAKIEEPLESMIVELV